MGLDGEGLDRAGLDGTGREGGTLDGTGPGFQACRTGGPNIGLLRVRNFGKFASQVWALLYDI